MEVCCRLDPIRKSGQFSDWERQDVLSLYRGDYNEVRNGKEVKLTHFGWDRGFWCFVGDTVITCLRLRLHRICHFALELQSSILNCLLNPSVGYPERIANLSSLLSLRPCPSHYFYYHLRKYKLRVLTAWDKTLRANPWFFSFSHTLHLVPTPWQDHLKIS